MTSSPISRGQPIHDTPGLRFRKVDLHVHTPASDDYPNKTITPESIVKAALSHDLAAIAITDHQTGEWIDRVQAAAKGTGLVVFPGTEILVTGGENGIHVICLFDVCNGTRHVNEFLTTIRVYQKDGKPTICTEYPVGQVADELSKYDSSALFVLAHCKSSKGVLSDMKGEIRKAVFEKPRPCLLAAETTEADFRDEDKTTRGTRVYDVLGGSDPNYGKRVLGVYQVSDAHDPSEIGRHFAWFKVDDPITIEDLRQCLIDRDTRIRQPHEFTIAAYPRISSVAMKGGFLADQSLTFNAGLNSILGGKGSGKSLVVEFLRFALSQELSDPEHLNADHNEKLTHCLNTYGIIEVTIQDESGKEYLVSREYNPSRGNPLKITDTSDGTLKEFAIDRTFPVLFLSQNEIISIAEDRSGRMQRAFIDRFFDFRQYQGTIERITEELTQVDRRLAEALRANRSQELLLNERKTLAESIERLGRQLRNDAFAQFSARERVGSAIQKQRDYIDTLHRHAAGMQSILEGTSPPSEQDEVVTSDPGYRRALDQSTKATESLKLGVIGLRESLKAYRNAIAAELNTWKMGFDPIRAEHEKLVKAAGGNQPTLSERRKQLVGKTAELDKTLSGLQGKAAELREITERRLALIRDLQKAHRAFSEARLRRCRALSQSSRGALQVTISVKKDVSEFNLNLTRFKRGSWLRDEEIEAIATNVSPYEFVKKIMTYEWNKRTRDESITAISRATKLPEDRVAKLFDHLLTEYPYEDILKLLYTSVPQDIPSIKYRVGSGYRSLIELSVGQKAAALLIMALSDGQFPVIIDQPEDSLDLRSIWQDVCEKVRSTKGQRQFIFTTHNSSVAVASDSDSFTILEAGPNSAKVLHSGSLNKGPIKEDVIQYLEGGRQTYSHKRQKYDIP